MRSLLTYSPLISVAFISWIVAQVLKSTISTIRTRRWDFSRLVDSGGMPSSHTAFVAGLSTAVGMREGFHSVFFAITVCFSLIFIYDATNLRRSAGNQAQVLNELVAVLLKGKVLADGFPARKLRELLGHTPVEVFVGLIIGILTAMIFQQAFSMR